MGRFVDLTGKTFGRLKVIEKADSRNKKIFWLCECSCENHTKVLVAGSNLKNSHVQSCGCLRKERTIEANRKYNTYVFFEDYIKGFDGDNNFFLIDTEDYEKIKEYRWCLNKRDKCWYTPSMGRKQPYLHRVVLNPKENEVVDHINRNPSDNRKQNLRICTFQENLYNKGLLERNTSGITGVSWNKQNNKWSAYLGKNKKTFKLGNYSDKEDAIKARLEAEVKYFGEFAPQKHLFEQYGISTDMQTERYGNEEE